MHDKNIQVKKKQFQKFSQRKRQNEILFILDSLHFYNLKYRQYLIFR